MVVAVEDVVLRAGFEAQVVERAEQLGAMVSAVVDEVEQHLPDEQASILVGLPDRPGVQRLVLQGGELGACPLLDGVPAFAQAGPVVVLECGWELAPEAPSPGAR